MEEEKQRALLFHVRMLDDYAELLQWLQEETVTHADFSRMKGKVEDANVPEEVKELHYRMIERLARVQGKLENLSWMSEHLKILHDLQQTFTQMFDKERIYQKAFELVSRVMDVDAFFIAFYRKGEENIYIPFAIDNGIRYESWTIPFGQGIVSEVLKTGRSIHIHAGAKQERKEEICWGNPAQDTKTLIFVPMVLRGKMKGVITAQSYREFAYKKEHEELLRIIGTQVASAIENTELYERMMELAIKDELTGLKNRRAFQVDLHDKIRQANLRGEPLSLLMIDSDNLKEINDTYGHHAGDLLLHRVAESINYCLGPREEAYRYAGDEFIVLALGADGETARKKAKAMQQHLRLYPPVINKMKIPASLSIGIDTYPVSAKNAEELKKHADQALYVSKKLRNAVTLYER
ncbi:diguanylate cyclase domain-containing protein [Aneurinibacillus thermoaerophilus]|uniref:Sensor domain-containing diguanylate cyclase n=1 Tax=Aneurinibacillus thermoaerophilus TaxID=143495 RepID=A0ABX8Y9F7_ANETH|nr:sensor domain-containing diguanylate cyclase [Aneurinibacillus thermoaerophilus]QYY42303.1 sensor domain-containing diguanylate cyclase [Aneurinibacillus thermoaerophilus]